MFTLCIYSHHVKNLQYDIQPTSYERLLFYFIHYILYFNSSILSISTIYVILVRYEELHEDGVLMSNHVEADHT